MTYLDQARAGDWGHEVVVDLPSEQYHCRICKGPEVTRTELARFNNRPCPHKIARFGLERAIEEIERLAKERCRWCVMVDERQSAVRCRSEDGISRYEHVGKRACDAQPEQRRLAELEKELEALTPAKVKYAR